MGEAERRLLDPRAPVVVSAKIGRAMADEIFGHKSYLEQQIALLQRMLYESSAFCAHLMRELQLDEVTLSPDAIIDSARLAMRMDREETADGFIHLRMRAEPDPAQQGSAQAPAEAAPSSPAGA